MKMNGKHNLLKPFNLLRLFGVVLFVLILTRVNLGDIIHVFIKIHWSWFLLGVILQVLLLFTKAIRWHMMNDGRPEWHYRMKSWGQFFESYAVGVATPGRLGEVLKAGHEKEMSGKVSAVIRMISERGFDLSIFLFFAALALVSGSFIDIGVLWGYMIMLISIILIVIAYILLTSGSSVRYLEQFISKMPFVKEQVAINNAGYTKPTIFIILLLSIAGAVSHFISCFFLAKSVGLDMPLLLVAGGVAIAGLLNLLPITILGLGTRELTFITLFGAYDHSNVMAFSFTILIVAQIGGGLFALIMGHLLLFFNKRIAQ